MTVAARQMHWTEEEYLAFENESATKHEYLDGEIFAMAGAKPAHNRVASNTLVSLGDLLRGRRLLLLALPQVRMGLGSPPSGRAQASRFPRSSPSAPSCATTYATFSGPRSSDHMPSHVSPLGSIVTFVA